MIRVEKDAYFDSLIHLVDREDVVIFNNTYFSAEYIK